MPVLVEAISLIVRRDAIEAHIPGGLRRFMREVPNATACMDDDLVRVGFMDPAMCEEFVHQLKMLGLTYLEEGKARDMVVCDQLRGALAECDWVELGALPVSDEHRVMAAWLYEGPRIGVGLHMTSTTMELYVPDGWEYEGSISQQGTLLEPEDLVRDLEYLRTENGQQVYWDKRRQREVHSARDEDAGPVAPRKRLS